MQPGCTCTSQTRSQNSPLALEQQKKYGFTIQQSQISSAPWPEDGSLYCSLSDL